MGNRNPDLINISYFYRKSLPTGHFSIESYFDSIQKMCPGDMIITSVKAPFYSTGFLNRLRICLHAMMHQGDINHITGDIHFIAPFLRWSKTILTIHDCGQLKIKSGLSFHILKFFWFTLPCKLVKRITVNSAYTKKDLLSYVNIPEDKISVIPIFVSETYRYFPKPFNKSQPVILQIGTAHNKNIDRTIQALAEIPCHLIILGKLNDAQISLLDDLKIKYTSISHALSESELYELYKSTDIVTLISTLEGFGMTIIEANQMGIPVITADITSMPWVAADAAVLVDPYDSQSIKNGFIKLIQNESYRNQLIENGYRNIKRFDKKVIAQQYFDLYRGLS